MAIQLEPKDDMGCRGVLQVVVKSPIMHIPPWYWFRAVAPGATRWTAGIALTCLIAVALSLACNKGTQPTARPVPVQTPTETARDMVVPTLGVTGSRAPTPMPALLPTATPTLTPTSTSSPTPAATSTPTPAPTPTPTLVPTATPIPIPTPTLVPTATPKSTPTAMPTLTPTAMPTLTPTPSRPQTADDYIVWKIGSEVQEREGANLLRIQGKPQTKGMD